MNKLRSYIPLIPAITTPVTCNFCLHAFWPKNVAFYRNHVIRFVAAMHPNRQLTTYGHACHACAEQYRSDQEAA